MLGGRDAVPACFAASEPPLVSVPAPPADAAPAQPAPGPGAALRAAVLAARARWGPARARAALPEPRPGRPCGAAPALLLAEGAAAVGGGSAATRVRLDAQ